MPLSTGARLGPYEVLSAIGAGGMGEVYKARDTRLDRSVAIKILPPDVSADPDRCARFQREAKTIAGLNPPHICTLYDVGKHDGATYLVMEHITGETLAQRLEKGPLPLEQALIVATEIADALAAAHRQGVIHRDLKPGNVMLTKTGAKLLDFGLAKLTGHGEQPAAASLASAPTRTGPLTTEGAIVGTLQYMAPEQVEGKPADGRSDLWALGAIIYEMLTGKRAFQGASAASLIANIMNTEPPALGTLEPVTPPALDRLVRQCLAKSPDDRPDTAHDLASELRWVRETSAQPAGAVSAIRRLPFRWVVAGAAVVLLALILVGTALMRYSPPATFSPVVRSVIKVEPGRWLDGRRRAVERERPSRTAVAISADGRFVVYSAIEENPGLQAQPQLYLRGLDQANATRITGTDGGIDPFLSPDNRWVGFWADGKLMKVPLDGGVPTPLCDAGPLYGIYGASWGPDNTIVFAGEESVGLSRVSADGGKPESLTTPDPKREEYSHRLPFWLPNGKAVLVTVMRYGHDSHPWLALFRFNPRQWRVLLQDAADARYVSTGHLVFLRQGTLMAVRFDLGSLKVVGQPAPVVDNVMQAFSMNSTYNTGAGQFAVSDAGALIYAAGGVLPDRQNSLVWVDQSGIEQPVTPLQKAFFAPRLSPDGLRIAYVTAGSKWQVFVYDLNTGINTRLTTEGWASYPIWTPDGQRIVFAWEKALASNLFSQPYDDSSPMERLTTSEHTQYPGSWSADGQTLAVVEEQHASTCDIDLLDARSRRVRPFLNSEFDELYPEFSPDGRWIAYASNESGRNEVYVRPFPGPGGRTQVSSQGGIQPLWGRGKRLFYRWQDQVWAVDVRTDGGFRAGKPRLLFERSGYYRGSPIRDYDLSADGQRFLMVKLEQRTPTPITEITLIENWFEELKAKVPVKR